MSNLKELKNTVENPLLLLKEIKNSGVEFKKLENLFNIRNGYTPSKKNESYWTGNTIIPWFRLEDIRENGRILKDSIQHVTPEGVRGEPFKKDSLIISTTATIGEYALIESDFLANQQFTILTLKEELKDNFLPKFLLYYCSKLSLYCQKNVNGTTFKMVDMAKFKDFEIPIPPLELQEEIVNCLDVFTNLILNLEKIIALRKKQYAYYLEQLLTFGEDTQKVKLGEIGKISMCKRIMKNETNSVLGVPFYKIGTFGGEADSYISEELFKEYISKYSYPKKGDILISTSGTIGKLVVFDGRPAYFQDSNIVWVANNEEIALNKYLYYIYQTSPWKITKGGTIARLYNGDIANTEIPLPTLDIQKEIVHYLDQFTTLISLLEKKLELTKKQYAYYRDELLRFEKE